MRAEICPVRKPPKSAPRAAVIWPNDGLSVAATGSDRFKWLNRFVDDTSFLTLTRSVMAKAWPRAVFRFTVPAPVTMPMPAFPKRPMGARSVAGLSPMVQGCPMLQLEVPGQVNAAGLNHWAAVGFDTEPLPITSGCCGR